MIEKMIEMWDKMHKRQLETFERWQGEPQWKECTRCKKQGGLSGTIRGAFRRKLPLCEVCVFELRQKGLVPHATVEEAQRAIDYFAKQAEESAESTNDAPE